MGDQVARFGHVRFVFVTALAAVSLALPAAPATATPTCDGKTATIVGSPSTVVLRGTERADVIVSNGAGNIQSLGGSDRVCLTGTTPDKSIYLVTGYGHDRVFMRSPVAQSVDADLGPGDDLYIGGPGRDRVESGTAATRDRIATGAGADHVTVGRSNAATADVVRLGDHSDDLVVLGRPAHGAVFEGGSGRDLLRVDRTGSFPDGRLNLDNTDEVARVNGQVVLWWDSFQDFAVFSHEAGVYFSGSHRPEGIYSYFLDGAAMGGGDDSMVGGVSLPTYRLRGGADRDRIVAGGYPWVSITGDVEAGRIDAEERDTRPGYSRSGAEVIFTDVEDLTLTGETVRVLGDNGPNRLDGYGCEVDVIGYSGNDILSTTWEEDVTDGCTGENVTISGGSGNDRMTGGRGPDQLFGGYGTDIANGRAGTDRCRAEQESNCEID